MSTRQSVAIFGTGAVGGLLALMAPKVEHLGISLTLIARNEHLKAMKTNGLEIQLLDKPRVLVTENEHVQFRSSAESTQIGHQDVVFLTIKSHSLLNVVNQIKPLIGPETTVVYGLNGIPYWYFFGTSGEFSNARLKTLDPNGELWNAIHPKHMIGTSVYVGSSVPKPGVVRQGAPLWRINVGEPDGRTTPRVERIAELIRATGLACDVTSDIRSDIFTKLLGNASLNPLSLLTHAYICDVVDTAGTGKIVRSIMEEVRNLANGLGVQLTMSVEDRFKICQRAGKHKISMLQDLEKGRRLETSAILEATQELAEMADVSMPVFDTVVAMALQRQRVAKL